jgi:hypothetical protein
LETILPQASLILDESSVALHFFSVGYLTPGNNLDSNISVNFILVTAFFNAKKLFPVSLPAYTSPLPLPLFGTGDQNNCLLVYSIDIAKTQVTKW